VTPPNGADTFVVTVDRALMDALDRFIHQPESRRSDVLVSHRWPLDPDHEVHWTIKHDLFAGVLMVASLVDLTAGRVVADRETAVGRADDVLGDIALATGDRAVRIRVRRG
jgi:hypothetical protein